jgi:hypothetical protein
MPGPQAGDSSRPDLFDEFFLSVLPWHLEIAVAKGATREDLIELVDNAIRRKDSKTL